MLKRSVFIALTIIFTALVFGCSKPVATVNGEKITQETFNLRLKEMMDGHKAQGAKVDEKQLKDAVLQELMAEILILQGAREKGISVTEDELNKEIDLINKNIGGKEKLNTALKEKRMSLDMFKKMIRNKMIIRKFVTSLADEDSIKEEEVRAYYKNSPIPFIKPERLYVRFIETEKEEDAKKIISEMKSKKIDFDKMADQLKTSEAAIVSDYGWVNSDVFSPSIAQALKDLKVGQYGGTYKGKDGYFIFKVKDKEPHKIEPYEEARDRIKSMLLEERRQATLAQWVEQKKQRSKIQKNL